MIGIMGGGQLGRMLAMAGYPLGLTFRVLDPQPGAPASHLAEHVVGRYEDRDALSRFARELAVITYEFESIPIDSVRLLARSCPVYPPPEALATAQDRLLEKHFFQRLGIPTSTFAPIHQRADLKSALERFGLPAVLKTRRMGYDGKGQVILRTPDDMVYAWERLGQHALILESLVPFEREVSLLAVRGQDGDTRFYPLIENTHHEGILHRSQAPAPDGSPHLQTEAETYAHRVLNALNYVGVLAIEFFQFGETLLANEMAPRVHNSGHWTIEGAETSQFANHLRAICGFPLGSTALLGTSEMTNLIGTIPDPASVLSDPDAHLHIYGKRPRPGRKLGHITRCTR